MLLYVAPTLYTPSRLGKGRSLVDVTLPEVGIELREGRDLKVRTPWPNKNWMVVCPKGNPPARGLLLDVGNAPNTLTVRTRWAIEARALIVHELRIELADHRHEVIAANADLWLVYGSPEWRWENVMLPWMTRGGTMYLNPFMPETPGLGPQLVREVDDVKAAGLVTLRRETMATPTIERDRYEWITRRPLTSSSRMPMSPIHASAT